MTDGETLDLISKAFERVAPGTAAALQGKNLEQLRLSTLGLDSIRTLELIVAIEEASGVKFHDHDLVRIDGVMDLVRLIQFKTNAKP